MTRTGADLIKKYREREGLNQKELAEKAELSRPYVSMLERGKQKNPKSGVVEKIAKALDLKPEEEELLRTCFNPPPLIEPSYGDAEVQREADKVWVFSAEPAEYEGGRSEDLYRDTLKKNLMRDVQYTYWTTHPSKVETALRSVLEYSGNETRAQASNLVECIIPPPEVNFFNFALYWFGDDNIEGRFSIREDKPNGSYKWSYPIDNRSIERILAKCRDVIKNIRLKRRDEDNPEYEGYKYYAIDI